jgi:hypothetical protein
MSPPQPEPARFNSALGAWVLSRYADVLAAVQEPRLWPAGLSEERDESGKLNARGEIQEALSFLNVRTWQETWRLQRAAPSIICRPACRWIWSVNTRCLGV